jgi:hypothetical protein
LVSVEHVSTVILASSAREQDILSRAANVAPADIPRLIADSRGAARFDTNEVWRYSQAATR